MKGNLNNLSCAAWPPATPFVLFVTLREQMEAALGSQRALSLMSNFFGGLALLYSAPSLLLLAYDSWKDNCMECPQSIPRDSPRLPPSLPSSRSLPGFPGLAGRIGRSDSGSAL